MGISKTLKGHFWLVLAVALSAIAVGMLSAGRVLAEPVDAGKEPADGPIFYKLTPAEGESVAQDKLSRVAATIEIRRDASLSWAGIFVDGKRRPSEVMGPTTYLRTVSADISDLRPGTHIVKVVALDSKGRSGSYVWRFTVVRTPGSPAQ